jgi:hypothetical protein
MPYVNSKLALEQENGLLAILLEATNEHIKTLKPDSLGAFIAQDWAGSFEKLQKLNAAALADDDENFKRTFVDEIALLAGFLGMTENSGFGASWAELFTKDIQIATHLLADTDAVK